MAKPALDAQKKADEDLEEAQKKLAAAKKKADSA